MDKMELSIGEQLYQALAGMVAGGVLGVLYDIFRQLRMHMSRFWGGVTDAVYALLAGTGLFILGQGPGGGGVRLFLLSAAACGGALYALWLSPLIRRGLAVGDALFCRCVGCMARLWPKGKKPRKKE